MAETAIIEVIDKDGWRKEFPLHKALLYIGSDGRNDIVLASHHGAGISPRHLQLISVANTGDFRLINLGEVEATLGPAGEIKLPPRAFAEVGPGDQIQVGDFTLFFQAGQGGGRVSGSDRSSNAIGLAISLPRADLGLGRPLDGSVTVRNLGDKTGVQFRLEVDGLDATCLEIGPGPMLFPNAEKEVPFRLHHPRAARPAAGEYRFRIKATAPGAYPSESAIVSQTVNILPYYSHKVELVAS